MASTAHYYGQRALNALVDRARDERFSRVLLVTGRSSYERCGAAARLAELEMFASVRRWSDFDPNPSVDDLRRGLAILRDHDPELIVGVGGGSPMDMAKLLCAFDGVGERAVESAIVAGSPVEFSSRTLFLVPTTSGSGSEATHFAVVYIGSDKYSVAGDGLRAAAVALDPGLTLSGSAHQRATSGVDAICQATESLWAVGATDRSRRSARHALGLLLPAIEPFVDDPTPQTARCMALGSHLAGRAIDVSKTTAAHALSYGITKRYGIDHGNAVALTLGQFVSDHAVLVDRLQPGLDRASHERAMAQIVDAYGRALGTSDAASVGREINELLGRLGLTSTLMEAGVRSESELTELADTVNVERLGNNPVVYSTDELVGVLARSLGR